LQLHADTILTSAGPMIGLQPPLLRPAATDGRRALPATAGAGSRVQPSPAAVCRLSRPTAGRRLSRAAPRPPSSSSSMRHRRRRSPSTTSSFVDVQRRRGLHSSVPSLLPPLPRPVAPAAGSCVNGRHRVQPLPLPAPASKAATASGHVRPYPTAPGRRLPRPDAAGIDPGLGEEERRRGLGRK
jgi:hypothetical protein